MGRVGFEPTTDRLRADCSTAELATRSRSYNQAARVTGSGPVLPGGRQQRIACDKKVTPFGQQGGHQQGQGLAVATGLPPDGNPLLQQGGRRIRITGVRRGQVLGSSQPFQESTGIIEAGIAGTEAIEAGIKGRQKRFEIGTAQAGQGVWTHAGRGRAGTSPRI